MKVRVHDDVPVYGGQVFEVERMHRAYKTIDGYNTFFGLKDVDLIEEVDKNCKTCKFWIDSKCTVGTTCNYPNNDFSSWQPKDNLWVETADKSKIVSGREQQSKIAGVGTDTPTIINEKGGKQSKIHTAFSLVPNKALLEVAKVMKIGSERYEKDNWRKLSADEIYDHLMEHLVNWHMSGDMEELSHAVTRAMMLYEVANNDTTA